MKKDFILFMQRLADEHQANGCFGTAHIYRSSMRALEAFHNKPGMLGFRALTPAYLKNFENHLRRKGCSWNTVSTYLRMIRAAYNRAASMRLAPPAPGLFKYVYTGTKADRKKALEAKDMALLMQKRKSAQLPPGLGRTLDLFILMFLMRGIPFADLVYLKKKDISGNTVTYRRRKTGRMLTVTLPRTAIRLLHLYINRTPSSPYLFPFLRSPDGSHAAYKEYQHALRKFNSRLAVLSGLLGLEHSLSSYTPRHTWATLAYYCEIHPGIISEALGHSSITVTETYLKPFRNKTIDEANRKVIEFVSRRMDRQDKLQTVVY